MCRSILYMYYRFTFLVEEKPPTCSGGAGQVHGLSCYYYLVNSDLYGNRKLFTIDGEFSQKFKKKPHNFDQINSVYIIEEMWVEKYLIKEYKDEAPVGRFHIM